jgi:DNA-binding transcriptional ArsR family regulator
VNSSKAVTALSALAHETRLDAYRMLVQRGPQGIPAGDLSERLGVPPSTLTFHLQHLVHAGLVTRRRMSRQIIYAPDVGGMNALVGYLTENCCGQAVCAPVCNPAAAPRQPRTRAKSA